MLPVLCWYGAGILITALFWAFYDAGTHKDFFYSPSDPQPDWYSSFCSYLSDQILNYLLGALILVVIAAPIYAVLLRCFCHKASPSLLRDSIAAGLSGAVNSWLTIYVLEITGQAVKQIGDAGPDFRDNLRSFINSGGIFALPVIATLISFLPVLLFNHFFRKPTIS